MERSFRWMPWWAKLMTAHRRSLYIGLVATVVCSLSASVVPFWLGKSVHALELGDYPDSRRLLIRLLFFTALAGLGRYFMRQRLIGLSRMIEKDQREELYASLLTRPLAFYEKNRIGDLMSRIGDDISTVRMATGPGVMSLLNTLVLLPATLGLMFHTSWRLTFAVLMPFSFLAISFYWVGRKSYGIQQKMQLVFSQLTTFSHETISGEKVVQAFGMEATRVATFRRLSREHARLGVKQTALFGAYMPIAAFISGSAILVLVSYGGLLVQRHQLDLGGIASFTGYLAQMTWPVMSLGWATNLFQRGKAGQERIEYLLSSPEAPLPEPETVDLPQSAAHLELRAVGHHFDTGRGVGPVNLDLPPGSSLGILGGIGSGKSILIQLMAGVRDPQEGAVLLDGEELTDDNLRRHWAGLGWVPQEAFLFSETLGENLRMGRPDATEAEILAVAEAVALDDLIKRLPQGLDTVVGERGVVLSGGERQRAALARALLRNPRLLLLDDALSAVDAETEARILESLRARIGGVTLIIATHRVFVAEACDRVAVLKEGRLVQLGTPEALAQEEGPFQRMRRLQSLERELVQSA